MKIIQLKVQGLYGMLKLLISITILLLCSCSPSSDPLRKLVGSYRNYFNANGKIENGVYYEPFKRFSIKVPNLITPGMVIDGKFIESGGTIVFMDDFGALVRIDLITVINEKDKELLEGKDQKLILSKLRDYFLALYKQTVPSSKIVYQRYDKWNDKDIDIFIADMKEGVTLAGSSGKRTDVLRASVLFSHQDSFYLVSMQPSILDDKKNTLVEKAVQMTNSLKKILDSMTLI